MHNHSTDPNNLTRNQALVLNTLREKNGPLTAYNILDLLRDEGLRAPLQIYRALDKLVEFGIVHKLESLNSFVACSETDCSNHNVIAFSICEDCERVTEFSHSGLQSQLQNMAQGQEFQMQRGIIELRGLCGACHKTQ